MPFLIQQNSSPATAPAPKPSMIDEWAASVKPKADPAVINKHIEKMVDVSTFLFQQSAMEIGVSWSRKLWD